MACTVTFRVGKINPETGERITYKFVNRVCLAPITVSRYFITYAQTPIRFVDHRITRNGSRVTAGMLLKEEAYPIEYLDVFVPGEYIDVYKKAVGVFKGQRILDSNWVRLDASMSVYRFSILFSFWRMIGEIYGSDPGFLPRGKGFEKLLNKYKIYSLRPHQRLGILYLLIHPYGSPSAGFVEVHSVPHLYKKTINFFALKESLKTTTEDRRTFDQVRRIRGITDLALPKEKQNKYLSLEDIDKIREL